MKNFTEFLNESNLQTIGVKTSGIQFYIYIRQNDDQGLLAADNSLVESPEDAQAFSIEDIEDAYNNVLGEYPNTDHEHRVEIMVYSTKSGREFYIDKTDLNKKYFDEVLQYAINQVKKI